MKRKGSVTNLEMGEKGQEIIGSSYSILPNIINISLSFSDIDLDSKIKYDLDEERRSHIYNYQATIIAYANTIQWNDAKYGMKDLPMPIFVIKSTHLYNNTKKIECLSFHNAEKVSPEATRQYVEQYLAHFLPEDEFDRLFKGRKK